MFFFLVNVFFCEFSEFLLGGEERWGLLRKLFVYWAEFCHVAAQKISPESSSVFRPSPRPLKEAQIVLG